MAVSLSQINAVVTKTLNWLRDRMVPTGTIICGLYTAPPAGYLAFKRTDRILKTQYPALCTILFKINGFKGDGSTYANIPDVDHRVIEMCSNVSEVGQLMEPALPNIMGKHQNESYQIFDAQYFGKGLFGAFGLETASNRVGIYNSNGAYEGANFMFNASRSNQLYKGSVFQPKSIMALAIVKI